MTRRLATRLVAAASVVLVAGLLALAWSKAREGRAAAGSHAPAVAESAATVELPGAAEEVADAGLLVRVLDAETGAAIPGCRVVAAPWDGPDEAVAETDVAGEARVERLRGSVRAERRGYVPRTGDASLATRLLILELRPAASLSGRVVRAGTLAPIEGADVEVTDIDRDESLASLVTDAEGRFEIPGVPPDAPFLVVAECDGFAPVGRVERRPAPDREILLEMGAGAVVEGRVLKPDGSPAPRANVRVLPYAAEPVLRDLPCDVPGYAAYATADDKGDFRVEGLRTPCNYEVRASDDELAEGTTWFEPRAEGERGWVSIRLVARTTLVVDVLFPEGAPPARPSVNLMRDGDNRGVVRNDPARFDLEEGGAYELVVIAPNWPVTRQRVDVPEGVKTEVVVPVSREGHRVLSGFVRNDEGCPLPYVLVTLRTTGGEEQTRTAADGTFHLCYVPAEGGTLEVPGSDLHDKWSRDGVTADASPVEVVLKPSARFVGRVEPVPRSRTVVLHMRYRTPRYSSLGCRPLQIGPDGSFSIPWAADRAVRLGFEPEGAAPLLLDEPPLAAGTVRDLGTLRFGPGFTAEAVVLDDLGRPVQDARVVVELEDLAGERYARTDAAGRFRFERLPDAPLHVEVTAPACMPRRLDLGGPRDLHLNDILLAPAGFIEVTVLDTDGNPRAGREVGYCALADEDEDWEWEDADSLGRLRVAVAPGRYKLEAGNDEILEVDVQARRTTRVEIRLKE